MSLEIFFELVEFFGKGEGAFINNASGGCSASGQFCEGRCSPLFKFLYSRFDMVLVRFEFCFHPFNFLVGPFVDGPFGVGDFSEESCKVFVSLFVEGGSPVFVAEDEACDI